MSDLTIGAFIGAGGYGSVYYAYWQGRKVAIKSFNLRRSEARQAAAIQNEIQMLEQLRDKHIIQFYGTTYDDQDMLVLVMEFAEGGSLHGAIEAGRLANAWPAKTRIAQEIVRGINYIHHKHILHRDLKSSNVLLTRHMEVKLCDFGLATIKIKSAITTTASSNNHRDGGDESTLKGTLRWMAPELFDKRPLYSTKSDMYAVGMVMWEMAADCTWPFQHQLDNAVVISLIKRGDREDLPVDTPDEYRRWVEWCWEQDPKRRPEARELMTKDELTMDGGSGCSDDFLSITFTEGNDAVANNLLLVNTSHRAVDDGPSTSQKPQSQCEPDIVEMLVQRAEANQVEAQMTLAAMYEKDEGSVKRDDARAFFWYYRAAEHGNSLAQYIVGHCYSRGHGTLQNYSEAASWYRKAAKQGHAEAQYNLGHMYHEGLGVDQDYKDAATWYRRAAEQGHAEARRSLGKLYEKGHGLPRDLQKAVVWYREATAQAHDPEVQKRVKKLIQKKSGVKKLFR